MSEHAIGAGVAVRVPQSELEELLSRCLAGEESAYVGVYNQYSGMIFRLCVGVLQQREDAEEVLQDTFEYAFRRLSRFDPSRASFATWLYQIAVSRCRNKRRRKFFQLVSLDLLSDHGSLASAEPGPRESALLTERQEQIWRAFGRLSSKLREAAFLRYYGGLSYLEIGQVLGIKTKTAESRLRLAHRTLKTILVDELGFEDGEMDP
jgi:RNA polymerase sigma-70 factor (ECF subfamily)